MAWSTLLLKRCKVCHLARGSLICELVEYAAPEKKCRIKLKKPAMPQRTATPLVKGLPLSCSPVYTATTMRYTPAKSERVTRTRVAADTD